MGEHMPRKIDISKMSLVELIELRTDIDKAMVEAKELARKLAVEEAQKAAERYGLSLVDLVRAGSKGTASKAGASARFRNPQNPKETWSGRGRRPDWFKAAIENGVPKENMEV